MGYYHGKGGRVVVGAYANGLQTITVANATGGTFTLTFTGTTTAIPYNATAAQVQAALVALVAIGAGNIAVVGPSGGPWTAMFTGALGGAGQALMTGTGAGLTGASPTVTITGNTASQVFLTLKSWESADDADEADCANMESGGQVGLLGFPRLKVKCVGVWNATQNVTINPPGLTCTDNGPPMAFFLQKTGGFLNYAVPITLLKNVTTGANVKSEIPYGFDCSSQFGYLRPDGTLATI